MWGGANNAKNLLVRQAPDPGKADVEVSVQIENRPTAQYEQVDLVWYYSDSFMVKLGQELVDGKLSVVMGREEDDRTRTIAIIPLDSFSVRLRLQVKDNQIHGQFRTPQAANWREVGACDLPLLKDVSPKLCLQFYQGPADAEHWALVNEFRVRSSGAQRPSQ
jgi:regulation of enolase protein 1 (concanavalin A-like superfamily)